MNSWNSLLDRRSNTGSGRGLLMTSSSPGGSPPGLNVHASDDRLLPRRRRWPCLIRRGHRGDPPVDGHHIVAALAIFAQLRIGGAAALQNRLAMLKLLFAAERSRVFCKPLTQRGEHVM